MAEHFEKPKKNAKEVVNGLFRKTFEHVSHHGSRTSAFSIRAHSSPRTRALNPICRLFFSSSVENLWIEDEALRFMRIIEWGRSSWQQPERHRPIWCSPGFPEKWNSAKCETYRTYGCISIKASSRVAKALPLPFSMTRKQHSGRAVVCFMLLAALMTHLVASEQLFFMWKWFSSQAYPYPSTPHTLPLSFCYCPPLCYRPILILGSSSHLLLIESSAIAFQIAQYAISGAMSVAYMQGVLLLATNRHEKEVTSFYLPSRTSK